MNYSNVFKSMVLLSFIFVMASCKKTNNTDPVADQAAKFAKGTAATISGQPTAANGASGFGDQDWTGFTVTFSKGTGQAKEGSYTLGGPEVGKANREKVWGAGGTWKMDEVNKVKLTPTNGTEAPATLANVTDAGFAITFKTSEGATGPQSRVGTGNWTFQFTY